MEKCAQINESRENRINSQNLKPEDPVDVELCDK